MQWCGREGRGFAVTESYKEARGNSSQIFPQLEVLGRLYVSPRIYYRVTGAAGILSWLIGGIARFL